MLNVARALYKSPGSEPLFFEGVLKATDNIVGINNAFIFKKFGGSKNYFIEGDGTNTFKLDEISVSKSLLSQEPTFESFIAYIQKIKELIAKKEVEKIVAARPRQLELNMNKNLLNFDKIFQLAINTYPNAYVSFVQTDSLVYFGISPELLLKGNLQKGNFETVALAGTVLWSEQEMFGSKEIAEQDFIVRHISEVFDAFKIDYHTHPQKVINAGHLAHLFNQISFTYKDMFLENVIRSLHPTPAIAGYPAKLSETYIKQNEKMKRGLYSGFSGVKIGNEITLSVNLRCLTILDKIPYLWAGAGITKDSNPINEWEETELKMQTLQKLIQLSAD
jgi:isochorismate synthase